MNYQYLKICIVFATFLVWLRLIVGVSQFGFTTMVGKENSPTVAVELQN
ncbi:MAG: hypothetical protein F6K10_14905 [Moorea sp. SIO2B7]|nr:hypothetical protein [Moorena sp. SIO2B7]